MQFYIYNKEYKSFLFYTVGCLILIVWIKLEYSYSHYAQLEKNNLSINKLK